MQKITPHLWFDKEAKEATAFYTSLFSNSKINSVSTIHDTPSGDCDIVSFELAGQPFMAISAGPYFKFNPSISFMVNFDPSQEKDAAKNIDLVWEKLSRGGKVLMELQAYPWSKHYGWIQDRYGLSWQLILTNPQGEERPRIIPSLLFTDSRYGKAEAAINFYLSTFNDVKKGTFMKYGAGQEPNKEGTVMFADFKLLDQWFVAMDGAGEHHFAFNEAVSFIVKCENQKEIDYLWEKLSAVPEVEQCGWLKDTFGVSWQITPTVLGKMMQDKDVKKRERVTQAFLKMKKFDIQKLEEAYKGK
ncbi:MAG: hypothetical protein RL557_673 [archaeon]